MNLKSIITKIKDNPNIFIILSSIFLLFAQVSAYQTDRTTDELIEAIDFQIKFIDLRATINEHLLRITLYGTEINASLKQEVFDEQKELFKIISEGRINSEYDFLI